MSADRLILGRDYVVSTDPAETGLNNNVIVCGTSGCGKTMSYAMPLLLETFEKSLIIPVTKRKIVNMFAPMFRRRNYEVLDLNFVSPGKNSVGYDPLRYVCSYQDISFLAKSIVQSDPRKAFSHADPYWDQSAASLLSAEIGYVLLNVNNATFADVLSFHDSIHFEDDCGEISTSVDDKFSELEAVNPSHYVVSCWKTWRHLPIKTACCVFSTLNTTLDTIFTQDIRKLMGSLHTVDIERLASGKSVLFITTSPVNPALHFLINLFYSQVLKQLFEFAENQPGGTLSVPVHILCDDFATGGRILNFSEYVSIFREKGVSASLLLQSESQLEAMYGSCDATTIINNCDSYIYMGGMDLTTAQHISLRLDTTLDEVLYMPVGREIVFRRGSRPVVTERYNITDDTRYQEESGLYEMTVASEKGNLRNFRQARSPVSSAPRSHSMNP